MSVPGIDQPRGVRSDIRSHATWDSQGYTVKVKLRLGGEVIDTAEDTIDVALRDTSERWRSTHEF